MALLATIYVAPARGYVTWQAESLSRFSCGKPAAPLQATPLYDNVYKSLPLRQQILQTADGPKADLNFKIFPVDDSFLLPVSP